MKQQTMTPKQVRYALRRSGLERMLEEQLTAAGVPEWEVEYHFAKPRRYRADFAWPEYWLIVEVQGGTHNNGRHSRHNGYQEDCRKSALAQSLGWMYITVTGDMVESEEAVTLIRELLERRSE